MIRVYIYICVFSNVYSVDVLFVLQKRWEEVAGRIAHMLLPSVTYCPNNVCVRGDRMGTYVRVIESTILGIMLYVCLRQREVCVGLNTAAINIK